MAEITASLVKTLREKTGAGMMDCKKALHEVAGDLEAAIDWLRKKGLAAAQKKAGRVAAEGLVGVASLGKSAGIVEVNAETDFIAKNTDFQNLVKACAELIAAEDISTDSLSEKPYAGEAVTIGEELTRLIAVIGENMNLRRTAHMKVSDGIVASYIHSQAAPGVGRIGVLVALESTGDKAKLEDLGRKIAMHVAAAMPQALNRDEVDPSAIERERNIFIDQARESGRPEEIIEKMVEGRLRKFYEDVCLEEQLFIMDGKTRVADVVSEAAKEIGAEIKMKGFIRFNLGEGIEKEASDFAAEVQAQINK